MEYIIQDIIEMLTVQQEMEYDEAMNKFYNSEVFTIGPIINGITCSMEEARANGENVTAKDINSVRTGLMGPVAGIGDTVMQGILFPILFGIGCSMALDGSYLGPIFATVLIEVLVF